MNTNYPQPPCSYESIDMNQHQPNHTYTRANNDVRRKINMDHSSSPSQGGNPSYHATYTLPQSITFGSSFNRLKQSFNSCMLLESPSYNLCATDSIDRLYYGTINGDVVLLPLSNLFPPSKAVLRPTVLRVPGEEPLQVFEVHGLKLDYAGRVWTCNASGLFVFDQSLTQSLFYMPDDRPDIEKADNYMEDIRRLQTDYNKRIVYWLMAGCIIRGIDSATCKVTSPDYQFNKRSGFAVRCWQISLDGQFLYVLYDNLDGGRDRFEVHSLLERKSLDSFTIDLNPDEFKGDTRYYSFTVDLTHGILAIIGITPDLQNEVEEDEYGEEYYVEDDVDPRDRNLVIRTYQLSANGLHLINVQEINQLEKRFYPYMINDCAFSDFEEEIGVGAGTLFLSVLGGTKKLKNYLILVRWNPQQKLWYKHLVIEKHHRDQQLSWEMKKNLLITTAEDASLSFNSFC